MLTTTRTKFFTLTMAVYLSFPQAQAVEMTDLWNGMNKQLKAAVPKLNQIQTVGNRKTFIGYSISLGQNKQSLREAIDRIMIESAAVLGGSELTNLKAKVNEMREKIIHLRAQQTELSAQLPGAVLERAWYQPGFMVSTKSDIEKQIGQLMVEIDNQKNGIVQVRQAMIEYLAKSNVLDNKENIEKQVDALLYTVTGDSDIQLISAYENLKTLTTSLEEFIAKAPTDEARKNYFGQYALLVRALISFHQDYLNKVNLWDARLSVVKLNAEKVIQEAKKTIQALNEKSEIGHRQAQQLNANIRLNERTIDLINRYQNYLKQSEIRVKRGLGPLFIRYEVAENTYNTFQNIINAGAIIHEIRETALSYLSLELPEMVLVVDSINLEEIENLNMQMMQ